MENADKKKIFILGGLCLFFLLLTLGLQLLNMGKTKVTRQGATGGPVQVFLSPATGSVGTTGLTVSLKVSSTETKLFRGAQTTMTFSSNVFDVSNLACDGAFPTVARREISGDKIYLACSQAGGETAKTIGSGTQITIGSFVLKPKSGVAAQTSGTVTLVIGETIVPESATYANLVGQVNGGTYTVAGGPAATATATSAQAPPGTVRIYANPDFPQISGRANTALTSFLKLNAGTNVVKNVTLVINYSPNKVELTNVTGQNGFVPVSGTGWSKASGVLTLTFKNETGKSGDFNFVKLDMKVATNFSSGGTTYLYACKAGTNCNINGGGNPYTLAIAAQENDPNRIIRVGFQGFETAPTATLPPTATATLPPGVTPSLTPSPTTVPGSVPVVNFKVKFQGIGVKRSDQKVKLIARCGEVEKTYTEINAVADNNGIYSGSQSLDGFAPCATAEIYIKGPKQIARKFCSDAQTIRCGSNQRGTLNLVAGANNLDFSKMDLMAGDLPLPDRGQDGVVNSLDFQGWKSRIGNEDSASSQVADVNLDGVVNVTDWRLMQITMENELYDPNL